MRRFPLLAVTVFSSLAVLVSASATATPRLALGTLKAPAAWRVGTVDNAGEVYCAMVGHYEGQIVAAFAQSREGFASVALDFGQKLFTPGEAYEVTLAADGAEVRKREGRASGERSVVVQIGRDQAFYDALVAAERMSVSMPAATLQMELGRFEAGQRDLAACAAQLAPSPRPRLEAGLAPIDRELQAVSQAQLAEAAETATSLRRQAAEKETGFEALEAKLEEQARAEAARSQEALAGIDDRRRRLRAQLAEKSGAAVSEVENLALISPAAGTAMAGIGRADIEKDEPLAGSAPVSGEKQLSPGRRLLASVGEAPEGVTIPVSTGASARDIEARQLALADAERAADETRQALALKDEIAALEAEKNRAAQERLAAFDEKRKALDEETARIAQARDEALARLDATKASEGASGGSVSGGADAGSRDRGARASVVAQQALMADMETARRAETRSLTRDLAGTQMSFEEKIAALEAERDRLRQTVESVTAENTRLREAAVKGSADDRLEIARLKKQLLEMETQRQAEIARAAAAQRELDEARVQIASLRQMSQSEQLRLAELQRSLEEERLRLRQSPGKGAVDSDLSRLQADLDAQRAEIERRRADLAREETRLESLRHQVTAGSASDEGRTLASTAGRLSPGQALLSGAYSGLAEAEKAELSALREKIQKLESDLSEARAKVADVALAAAPIAAQPAVSAGDRQEISRLQAENASLRQRIASLMSAGRETPAAAVSAAVAAAPAMPAVPAPRVEAAPAEMTQSARASQDRGVFGIFNRALGERKEGALAVPAQARPAAAHVQVRRPAKDRQAAAESVVPAAAVAPVATASSADANRAEAFLDTIMAFHRPDARAGGELPAENVTAEVRRTGDGMESPARGSEIAARSEPLPQKPRRPAAAPEVVEVPARASSSPTSTLPAAATGLTAVQPHTLAGIETAAGTAMAGAVSRPVADPSAASRAVSTARMALPDVLNRSGVGSVTFTGGGDEAGQVLRQWTTGEMNGLFERQSSRGDTMAQVESYLSRYRADCPGRLSVQTSPVQAAAAGAMVAADIRCAMTGNVYATSIAFLDTPAGFQTILHAARPDQAERARRVTAGVMATLKPLTEVVPVSLQVTPAAAAGGQHLRFHHFSAAPRQRQRIEIEAPAALSPEDAYGLPTIVIE